MAATRSFFSSLSTRRAAMGALVASALALIFAAYSTYDYAEQLDRQVHAVHCSFIPGLPVSTDAENPCKAALFSAYSAIFRGTFWGGVPISLFALGVFAFTTGFAFYLWMARQRAHRLAWMFLLAASVVPVGASLAMMTIAIVHLHAFCKLCVGIYVTSFALAAFAYLGFRAREREEIDLATAATMPADAPKRARNTPVPPLSWVAAFAASALLPALVYVAFLPDYRPLLDKCGKLSLAPEHHGLLKLPTAHPTRAALLFEDPLCPTCKAFHQRLVDEGIMDKLDVTLALFPLDNDGDCNWMVDRSLHPGACVMSKAVICGGADKARAILEWAYDEQATLTDLGKQGGGALAKKIGERWGSDIASCIGSARATAQLNMHLHYAANAHVPVSTPQMYLGDRRICDEDTDLGLRYTMTELAPEVLP